MDYDTLVLIQNVDLKSFAQKAFVLDNILRNLYVRVLEPQKFANCTKCENRVDSL